MVKIWSTYLVVECPNKKRWYKLKKVLRGLEMFWGAGDMLPKPLGPEVGVALRLVLVDLQR